jgi:phage repressor protein C with HTH and peptisase S24 domain
VDEIIKKERAARLKHLRIQLLGPGSNASDLARIAGVNPITYRALESGKRLIDDAWAIKLAPTLQVTPEELLRFGHESKKFMKPVVFRSIPLIAWSALGEATGGKMTFNQLVERSTEFIPLPVVYDLKSESCVAVSLPDDSMAPAFPAGTTIVLDVDKEWSPGDLVIAFVVGIGPVFRRYGWSGVDEQGRRIIDLIPNNALFPNLKITQDVTGEIIARAVVSLSRL